MTSVMQLLISLPSGLEWVWISSVVGISAIVGIILLIFFILNLQGLLHAISPKNRQMEPGMVWLLLVPILNLVWLFLVVINVSKSIKAEYDMRSMPVDEKPTYQIGLAMAILMVCSFVPFASLAFLICFIIYWIKTNEYKTTIKKFPPFTENAAGSGL